MVEQTVEAECLLVERHILGVNVADTRHDSLDDSVGVHLHPEEMARIQVGVQILAEGDELFEGLHVVDRGPRVQLDADLDVGVFLGRELGQLGPVRNNPLLPLPVVYALQIGSQPPAPKTAAWSPATAAGAPDIATTVWVPSSPANRTARRSAAS